MSNAHRDGVLTRSLGVVGAVLLGLAVPASGQDSPPSLATRAIAPGVWLLSTPRTGGSVVNSVVVRGTRRTALVDHPGEPMALTVSEPVARAFRSAVEGVGATTVDLLVNTHWHGDHSAGNPHYPRSTIVAHRLAGERLRNRQAPFWKPDGLGPMAEAGWPTVLVSDSLLVDLGGQRLLAAYLGPAHTDGDLIIFLPDANTVFVGDLFRGARAPSFGDDMVGLAVALTEVDRRINDQTRVLSGHGAVATREELRTYLRMLQETLAHARATLQAGGTRDRLIADGLPAPWTDAIASPELRARWLWEMHRTLSRTASP